MVEYVKEKYVISSDKSKFDIQAIHEFLSTQAYWAIDRPLEVVEKAIENSHCFGVFDDGKQVGLARVVTDFATFAWLCDVYIIPEYRGLGLSKWLVECAVNDPEIRSVRRFLLATRDAHELYQKYAGFENLRNPERWMERINPNISDSDYLKKPHQ
jgi:GNAT superfamily N-acetyltransferase